MTELLSKKIDWQKNAEYYSPAKTAIICFAVSEERYINEYREVFNNVRILNYSIPLYYYDEAVDKIVMVGKVIRFTRYSHSSFPEFIEYIEGIGAEPEESMIIAMKVIIDNFSIDIEDMTDYQHNKLKQEYHIYPKNGRSIVFYYADKYIDPDFPYEDELSIDPEAPNDYVHLAAIIISQSLDKDLKKVASDEES